MKYEQTPKTTKGYTIQELDEFISGDSYFKSCSFSIPQHIIKATTYRKNAYLFNGFSLS